MNEFERIIMELNSLIEGNEYDITILANSSALLFNNLKDLNWVGFYKLKDNFLYLSAFQGNPACIKIKVGSGVCGHTILVNDTVVVNNVHEFKGHIACDSNSKSEICVPIYKNNKVYGLLDIDSPIYNRFNDEDKIFFEKVASIISKALDSTSF